MTITKRYLLTNKKKLKKTHKRKALKTTQKAGFRFWVSQKVEIYYHKKEWYKVTNAYASESESSAPEIHASQLAEMPYFRFPHLKFSGNYLIACRLKNHSTYLFIKQFKLGISSLIGEKKKDITLVDINVDYINGLLNKARSKDEIETVEYTVYSLGDFKEELTVDIARRILSGSRPSSSSDVISRFFGIRQKSTTTSVAKSGEIKTSTGKVIKYVLKAKLYLKARFKKNT